MTAAPAGRRSSELVTDVLPVDLIVVVATALLVDALVLTSVGWAPVTFVLGAVFLFFLPGYALLAALYPGRPRRPADERGAVPQLVEPHDGLVFEERLALSFGTSVAMIPVVAVILGAIGLPLTATTVLGSLTVVVVLGATAGAIHRARLAPSNRYVPFGGGATRGDGGSPDTGRYRGSRALTVGLVLAVALAGGAFAYGIAAEPPSTPYTSATLLTTGEGGNHVASGYPANATVGEPIELTLRVDNRQAVPTNVTAVGVLERVAGAESPVEERDRLVTLTERLSSNERWNGTHEVAPTFAGEDLRLAYYLYDGEPAETIGPETADRELYLRIDVADE